jgi:predicted PurR-regulated permease PerM|nr:MAG TPA: Metal binding domain of Ada [Caudoviricetes sp.]
MMENKTFRWIAFAVSAVLAVIAIFAHTFSGFLCFAVAAFILIPVNQLFEKLDSELDPKYRKRATAITAGIFLVCGLLAFTTAGSHTTSSQEPDSTATTTTTAVTTTTAAETTTTTTKATTTTTTTTTTEATTTAAETTTAATEPPAPAQEETPAEQPAANVFTYVINTGSGIFHYPSCSSAKRISDANRSEYTGTRDDLIAQGYSPCGNCDP